MLLVDRSPSQTVGERPQQLEEALPELRAELGQLEGLEVVEATTAGDGKDGTRLFATLGTTLLRDRPRAARRRPDPVRRPGPRRAGRASSRSAIDAPLHLLLTGERDERDRRLLVEQVPNYGMVGDQQEITLRVDELPDGDGGEPVTVTLRQDGELRQRLAVPAGVARTVPFQLTPRRARRCSRSRPTPAPGEVTTLNNRQVFFVNGVRDRLRVLLVSGQPYPGLRVWRNLLKADPAVDLVHFTILRPPEKQDGTPIRELALIAFPSRELFEVKLSEFDLVIFDRYSRRGLLPLAYLDNVARYVEDGGALLEVAGPEFAHPLSLYRTPLARVLPARPSGVVYERGFTPTLTELGQRHPVTAGLVDGADDGQERTEDQPPWGRWFRQVDVEVAGSQVLMSGAAERPLLVLDRVGEGRVAQLLSDHAWLWARGFEGGGPQGLLLRRLVHWLMQEPELEEEALRAEPVGDSIAIERRSLQPEPETATVTAPSGAHHARSTLEPVRAGRRARDRAGRGGRALPDRRRRAHDLRRGPPDRRAGAVRHARDARTAWRRWSRRAAARSTGWPTAARPASARSTRGRALSGRDWVGLQRNERYLVTGASQISAAARGRSRCLLLLGTLGFAWYREGR